MSVDQNIKIAVDAVVFSYEKNQLAVLLVKQKYGVYKDKWVLPGGLVLNKEPLKDAVRRELKEEAGISVDYMEQLYTYGDDVERDQRGRVISVAYMALVNPDGMKLEASTDAIEAKWFKIDNVPNLAFDHNQIVVDGLARLRNKIHYQPIGFDLLPTLFPFSALENLYKTISGRNIDRRNFRKKILSFEILEETNKVRQEGSGRPGKLFKFNKSKYDALVEHGFHFEIKYA
ncbi:MAG: NUDIX hydrolase [Flavobacteriales bacterium]|jgi:8-oxo-dGTP diphosphatase|nr:NUDIX hydrolase [Flavobacteriales bacterium]